MNKVNEGLYLPHLRALKWRGLTDSYYRQHFQTACILI